MNAVLLKGATRLNLSQPKLPKAPDPTDALANYLLSINQYPRLNEEEEIELFKKVAEGEVEAVNGAINANLRLVVSIASHYRAPGLSLLDLIEEGNLGLITAVAKFDFSTGNRFSTYAAYWIKHSIRRAIENSSHTIRIPSYRAGEMRKLHTFQDIFEQANQRPPTIEEASVALSLPEKKIKTLREDLAIRTTDFSSLSSEEDPNPESWLPDSKSIDPAKQAANADFIELVLGKLDTLGPRQRQTLILRFGLKDGSEPLTLKEVGEIMGITRERVRQIESAALVKLRQHLGHVKPDE